MSGIHIKLGDADRQKWVVTNAIAIEVRTAEIRWSGGDGDQVLVFRRDGRWIDENGERWPVVTIANAYAMTAAGLRVDEDGQVVPL